MKAAIYARVSTEEQSREGVSLAAQQERCAAYCVAQAWDVAEVYVDGGYSGKDLKRPALQHAVADARAGRYAVLVVWRLDRLSRRQRDVLHLVEDMLAPHGVGLRSITESFDTTSAAGRAMLGMLSVFAQLERDTIVERTRAGKAQAAKQGRRIGTPPYGYRLEDGRMVPQEPQASFVRGLYERYLSEGIGKLVIWANERSGCRPLRADRWAYNALRVILTNPTYIGLQRHRGATHPAPHAAIVSPELWRAVQDELARRRETHMGRVRAEPYLLSGLRARCGLCGAPIHGTKSDTNWPRRPAKYQRYYVCSRARPWAGRRKLQGHGTCKLPYLRRNEVEAAIRAALRALAWDEDLLQARLDQTPARRAAAEAEAAARTSALRSRLGDVERRLRRWYDAFEAGGISPADLSARTAELSDQKGRLALQLAEAAEVVPRIAGDPETQALLGELRCMADVVDRVQRPELREFLRLAADGIVIYPDRVEVHILGVG